MKLISTDDSKHPYYQKLIDGIVGYNGGCGFPEKWYSVAVYAENDEGKFLGGVHAEVEYDYLFIQRLWVLNHGKGLGSQLLEEAESIAHKKQLKGLFLDTFEFQARDFYIKHGYRIFGEIPNAVENNSRFFMIKTF
jgi:GNAT superfamily N-acetyltransferase